MGLLEAQPQEDLLPARLEVQEPKTKAATTKIKETRNKFFFITANLILHLYFYKI